MNDLDSLSKFISLILRHKPEVIDIKVDEHGWADVNELIAGINKTRRITAEQLETIVRTDNKQRYSFNEDHTKIRANQGHSINVDVELEKKNPPGILYHGTCEQFLDSILREGLRPQSRLYVHLSADIETATKVGERHGKPVVLEIDAGRMDASGFEFYESKNKVWLTKKVPVQFITRVYTR